MDWKNLLFDIVITGACVMNIAAHRGIKPHHWCNSVNMTDMLYKKKNLLWISSLYWGQF